MLKGGAIAIYDEAGKKGKARDTTINVLGRAEPFPGSIFVVDVRLDFARSMDMHRSEYNRYEILSIVVAILVELLQAAILLRLLRISALRPVAKISFAMESVAEGRLDTRIDHVAKDEFGTMAKRFNDMVKSLDEKERLSKYVSRSTIAMVRGNMPHGAGFHEPVRKKRVVFFSDIRGFTSFSETVEPETVIRTLNRILDIQANIINACGGEIDKFVGDEIMAVFESPRTALICALKIQMLLEKAEDDSGLRVGIGICEGIVVEGDVGFDQRKDFTVIGDAVNTAARFRPWLPRAILVPSEMMSRSGMSVFKYALEGSRQIKGKREKLVVASVMGINETARRRDRGMNLASLSAGKFAACVFYGFPPFVDHEIDEAQSRHGIDPPPSQEGG